MKPADATGVYRDHQGNITWIKDLDLKQPNYPLAYVWSFTTKRWKSKRELIRMDHLRLFDPVS